MFQNIYKYFPLILCISRRDILTKITDMKLGLVWIVLPALLPILAYSILAILGIRERNMSMPFAIYVATGFTIYMYISSFIKATISTFSDKVLLKTYNLPIFAVVLIKNQITFIELGIRSALLIGLYLFYEISVPLLSMILIPGYIILLSMFSYSIGVIAGLLNVVYKDIGQLFILFLRYGLFISSVIFPFPKDGWIGMIGNFNILNTYVENIRNIIVYGLVSVNNIVFIITIVLTVVLFFFTNKFLIYKEVKIKELL